MGSIPRSSSDTGSKYSMEHIKIIENASVRLRKSPFDILLEEWGTSGRVRPRLHDFICILQTSAQFNQALHYVNTEILNGIGVDLSECRSQTTKDATKFCSSDNISKESESSDKLSRDELTDDSKNEPVLEESGPVSLSTDLPRLTYSFLHQITESFSDKPVSEGGTKIGEGSFGIVNKGRMNGQLGIEGEVAVKRMMKGSVRIDSQFGTEIECMRYVQHVNLLQLLAYCNDGPELCLVYEYMANGNLGDRLRLEPGGSAKYLTAVQRLSIAVGAAEGLSYLHNHSHSKVLVHRDVKPENILLDSDLRPKISDFGLVRLTGEGDFGLSVDQTNTLMGTPLYMAPEAMRGEVSDKMDVYSFGVVLLEIITSIPAIGNSKTNHQSLVSYIEDEDDISDLMDRAFSEVSSISPKSILLVAQQCLNLNRRKRPPIEDVKCQLKLLM
ncbi:interleukin-1 receptor-associated kinase 4 [Eurytemora carolleeae]|uniref:interleukin-1 receptor-associated kinase 4 n=1 Tax=Eurytemora carolleeae TaxID=1294199 RepID=UPI000C7899A8|nr:interleukin-1 receptor-associated kinase 4 [Eurytemora carolleeae]|eukprot:XP_023323721.1 interleukin-1 receptor-associated kinase 4-like [Eurytemora affinis]